ncbi:MAG TPA: DinB family protein [Anaerolineales bacterium]|nr:DinB family protein [Anaerolineales bacterium]
MKATRTEIEKYLKSLEETPRSILNVTKGIDDKLLQVKSDRNSWAMNDILAHLRSCADVWTYSIYAMLAENELVLPDINERKWAKVTGYADVPFRTSLQAFTLQRENLLFVLKTLPFESWEKSAVIFERKHTIFTQVRRMAKHEKEHCEQMRSLLSRSTQR